MYAAYSGSQKCSEILLKHGAKINETNDEGLSALLIALAWNKTEHAKHLIDAHANIDQTDIWGRSALMYAAKIEDANALKYLLKKEANIYVLDKQGNFALDYATENNCQTCVDILTQHIRQQPANRAFEVQRAAIKTWNRFRKYLS